MTKLFTGGVFSINVEKNKLYFYCRNIKFHPDDYSENTASRNFSIEALANTFQNESSYTRAGIRCCEYDCGKILKTDERILVSPVHVQGLMQLSKIKTKAEEIALYLRYHNFFQITPNDKYRVLQWLKSPTDPLGMSYVKIVDINRESAYAENRDFLLNKYCYVKPTVNFENQKTKYNPDFYTYLLYREGAGDNYYFTDRSTVRTHDGKYFTVEEVL